jgi:hypothetical protein
MIRKEELERIRRELSGRQDLPSLATGSHPTISADDMMQIRQALGIEPEYNPFEAEGPVVECVVESAIEPGYAVKINEKLREYFANLPPEQRERLQNAFDAVNTAADRNRVYQIRPHSDRPIMTFFTPVERREIETYEIIEDILTLSEEEINKKELFFQNHIRNERKVYISKQSKPRPMPKK